jgi:hypothetical protein
VKASASCSIALVGLVILAGCERDLPYMGSAVDEPINGYRLEGYVTDKLGIPIRGLQIALWYDFEYVDSNNPPVRQFNVDDSTKIARVAVFDTNHRLYRVLFQGKAPFGVLDYLWDLKDSTGVPAPTGIYKVDFSMNGATRSSFTQVVNGTVTVVTDSLGHYLIPNELLPVGFYPAPLYSANRSTFLGNFQVSSFVNLEFYLPLHRYVSVTLIQDQVTRFDYRI